MRRYSARDIMSTPAFTARPSMSVIDANREMHKHRITGLPVVDDDGRLIGMVLKADLPTSPLRQQDAVRDVMSRVLATATEETPAAEIANAMLAYRIDRIPVLRGSDVIGIVTRSDILAIYQSPPSLDVSSLGIDVA